MNETLYAIAALILIGLFAWFVTAYPLITINILLFLILRKMYAKK